MQPTIGGSNNIDSPTSLRGFADYRFRAPDATFLQGEYSVPQWSGQKRPMVVGSKAANGCSPERGSFILVSPGQASPFSFSSFLVRISVCDRSVAAGRAWQ